MSRDAQHLDPAAPRRSQAREAAPQRFVWGCCCPLSGVDLASAGLCTTEVLPLAALRRNPSEHQGASKSPCPRQVPAMEVPSSAVPYCGDPRLPPGWVTAPLPAFCPLPSPPGAVAARGTPFTDLRPCDSSPGKAGGRHRAGRGALPKYPEPWGRSAACLYGAQRPGAGRPPPSLLPRARKGSREPAGSRPEGEREPGVG